MNETKRHFPVRVILVAVDFSETSKRVLPWAFRLAREQDARLHLLHAVTPVPVLPEQFDLPADLPEQLRTGAETKLKELAESAGSEDLEITWSAEYGQPSETIAAAVERRKADLVVLGTRGLTGLEHLLLGSTAERVLRLVDCPVFNIHPKDREAEGPLTKVLVPTDFSDGANDAIQAALEILPLGGYPAQDQTRGKASLILLNVHHAPGGYGIYGPGGALALQAYNESAEDLLGAELERLARPLRARGVNVEVCLRQGYPSEVIVHEAAEQEVDVIVMGTHGRSGLGRLVLGSTTERVVQHAGCPVLTVRRGEG
jgi:nucleotide-binding universal stress UspA family protein